MLIGISPLQDKMRAVNGILRISCTTPYIHTSIPPPLFIIGMDIEGGSWDSAFLVETSNDTSSVQTVTAAQEDDLLMETGEDGPEVDPKNINKPSLPKEKGVPGEEKEVAALPRFSGTTPRGPNFEKNQRKREKRQRRKNRPAEAAGTEASGSDPKLKDPAGNADPTVEKRNK